MKHFFFFVIGLICISAHGQYITVNYDFSPQELVEDILINSGCIENVTVTNTVSGNFGSNDSSFGYFENNNSNFPFDNGIVMSTGKISNVPGPNTSLSDDDAPGWGGDQDLEDILGVSNTTNATVLEFDFTPNANLVQFRYIFASEEYQEGDANTCIYSDVFAFLIKPQGGTYTNIAVVPGTNIPVQVTTVHPEIPGSCDAENEEYFESFNDTTVPINFNGQTKALTATASVVQNTTYHIKLIIADEQNYRYDSAVFLEGGSFNIGADLGNDITGENALCEGETYTLQLSDNGNTPQDYTWLEVDTNGNETILTQGQNVTSYTVDAAGTYKVILDYGNGCTAEDEIIVAFADFSNMGNRTISECDDDSDGLTIFNLSSNNNTFTNNNPLYALAGYYFSQDAAENETDPIPNPSAFENTSPNQIIYARIETQRGCFKIIEITLSTPSENYNAVRFVECAVGESIIFNLNNAIPLLENEVEINTIYADFFATADDAITQENPIDTSIEILKTELPKSIYARAETPLGCEGIVEVILDQVPAPPLEENISFSFCGENNSVEINSGVIGNLSNYSFLWDNGATTPEITVSEDGTYEVSITQETQINGFTYSCSVTNSISVTASEKAIISHNLLGDFGEYQLEIIAAGIGDYTYAVNSSVGPYTSNPIFEVNSGKHTIYVKDENGCGISFKEIYVIGYMKFFTPNQDGANDRWRLLGTDRNNRHIKRIVIFDRFGKMLQVLSPYDSWDGSNNGKNLPSNEYWFRIELLDGSNFKSHFTLKR
ncbi:choice-of-anchor L domain-containing protein [Mesonia ostreae]|uniref:Choice-of-anchor L domain-containing protein n=1 Tax=Mesonia ostreae TaxID=861110 RepID=A0ABU2KGQ2_9FLAO|nr:choice-of-anchor L domain-containing protein [Mesonia ostreae]MDT0293891.1 choice-of-anchor L domain-containing protein [Mesonia ostreae]